MFKSTKRKKKGVVGGSSEQFPLPPATNQFDRFSLKAGKANHFPSPSNFPTLPNGHRFASPTNCDDPVFTEMRSQGEQVNLKGSLKFPSPSNIPPRPNVHPTTSNFPPPSNGHHFSSPRNIRPHSNGHHFSSKSNVPPPSNGGHHSQVQQILNAAATTIKPFSFMSMLMAEDDEEDHEDPLVTEMRSQAEHVNQIITLRTDILQQAVGGMLERQQKSLHRAAEEQATKKLRQKETQVQIKLAQNEHLERQAEHYKEEGERLTAQMRQLEEQTRSLKLSLDQAYAFRRYREADLGQEESSESSTPLTDPGTVGPIVLECKICNVRLSTVMVLPCRHVSVCTWCEPVTNSCPVCGAVKRNHVQLKLSNLNW